MKKWLAVAAVAFTALLWPSDAQAQQVDSITVVGDSVEVCLRKGNKINCKMYPVDLPPPETVPIFVYDTVYDTVPDPATEQALVNCQNSLGICQADLGQALAALDSLSSLPPPAPCDTIPPPAPELWLGYSLTAPDFYGPYPTLPLDGATIQADSIWIRLVDPDTILSGPVTFYVDEVLANIENSWPWDMWSRVEWPPGEYTIRVEFLNATADTTFFISAVMTSPATSPPPPPPPPGDRVDEWPTTWELGKVAIRRDLAEHPDGAYDWLGVGVCLAVEPVEFEGWLCRYEQELWCGSAYLTGSDISRYVHPDPCQFLSERAGVAYPDTLGQPAWAMGPFN